MVCMYFPSLRLRVRLKIRTVVVGSFMREKLMHVLPYYVSSKKIESGRPVVVRKVPFQGYLLPNILEQSQFVYQYY
jgi:hypothetical protein